MANAFHLNQEQISRTLAGLATREESAHVDACEACRAEIEQRTLPLKLYRDSLRGIGERPTAHIITWTAPNRWRINMVRLAGAAALAMVFLGIPVVALHLRDLQRQRAATQLREDAALLDSVNQSLSRSVPESFEPLDKMVAWTPSSEAK